MIGRRRLDRILAPGYLDDLAGRSTDEIRAMRDECAEEEGGVSFARRMLQGKLDILRAEAIRRQESGTNGDLQSLLDALPQILSDDVPARPLRPRVPRILVPSVHHQRREVERLVEEHTLALLEEKSTEELSEMVHLLAEKERELSELRRQLFDRLDALQEELTRRYQRGEASVTEVLPRQA
ncbi:MAG: aerial mycelium formation protein [Actinomycetota bacterium]|nr:aerial mycelium formation protein [Actinomycetota bacterium]